MFAIVSFLKLCVNAHSSCCVLYCIYSPVSFCVINKKKIKRLQKHSVNYIFYHLYAISSVTMTLKPELEFLNNLWGQGTE
jgi:hypothetical protein